MGAVICDVVGGLSETGILKIKLIPRLRLVLKYEPYSKSAKINPTEPISELRRCCKKLSGQMLAKILEIKSGLGCTCQFTLCLIYPSCTAWTVLFRPMQWWHKKDCSSRNVYNPSSHLSNGAEFKEIWSCGTSHQRCSLYRCFGSFILWFIR